MPQNGAPRLRRTQRRVGSLLPTSRSLYSRRHCGSRNTRFNVGSETKYGEERSAACSVRVSTKRCSTEPFLHRQEMSVGAIKMVVHISTAAKRIPSSGSAHHCLLRAEELFRERERAGSKLRLNSLKHEPERGRERLQRTLLCCGHRSRETSAADSSHLVSFLPLNVGEVSCLPGQQEAERTCTVLGDKPPISAQFTTNQSEYFCGIPAELRQFFRPRRAGAGASIDFLNYRVFIPTVSEP